MNLQKTLQQNKIIIVFVLLAIFLCIVCSVTSFLVMSVIKKRSKETGRAITTEVTEITLEDEAEKEESLYPDIEELIGLELSEVEEQYPNGNNIESKTTWGTIWRSYEYENDLFILTVDGKETGVIDSTTLVVKMFTGCKMDESILDIVDEILPYAGFDPTQRGPVSRFAVSMGVASYFEYKEGYTLSITCYFTPKGDEFYQVNFFENSNGSEN